MGNTLEMATLLWKAKIDNSNFTNGLAGINKQANDMQNHFNGLSGFMSKTLLGGILGVSGGLAGMATVGVKSALDLQGAMKNFQAQTGMSADETDKVKSAVKNMFVATGESYSDLAKMATDMHNQMGMGSDDISKYGSQWVKFSKLTKQSDDETIQSIAGIKNAWHLSNGDIQPLMDKLILSQQKYGLAVTDSQQSLKSLAPAFQAAHMNINQGIAYLDLFKKAGLDSSSATIAFNTALRKVKSPQELQTIITKMQNTKDDSERARIAMETFGKQGLTMSAALKPGSQSLADIQKALNGAAGATDKAGQALAKGNISVELAKIKRTSEDMLEGIGEKALPTIQGFIDKINKNMPSIQNTVSKAFDVAGKAVGLFGDGIKFAVDHSKIFMPVVAGLAAGMGTLKVISTVSGFLKAFQTNTILCTIASKGLGAAIAANPIGAIITVIGLAVTAGVALYENWGTIKKAAGELKTSIGKHFEEIKKNISETWDNAKKKTQDTWDSMKEKVNAKTEEMHKDISNKWNSIKQNTSDTWNNIKSHIGNKADEIKENIGTAWDNIKQNTSNKWDAIKQSIQDHGGGIKGVIGTAMEGYKNIWDEGFSKLNTITGGKFGNIVDTLQGKFETIWHGFKDMGQKIKDIWKDIWNFKLPHIPLPHFNVSGKFSLNPPSIPSIGVDWYAKGGIFNQPRIIGVGEAGQEAVVPIDRLEEIMYNVENRILSERQNTLQQPPIVHNEYNINSVELPNVFDGQSFVNELGRTLSVS